MGTREFASLCRVPMAAITRLLHTKTSYNLVFLYRVSCGMDIDLRKLLDD